jgi:hypothetical protein
MHKIARSTGAESVHLRVLPDQSAAIDDRIAKQKEADLSRPEAISRLVDLGLTLKTAAAKRAARALELAAKAIEKMIDHTATADERVQRRRRLTKAPPEFREDRVDLTKSKS